MANEVIDNETAWPSEIINLTADYGITPVHVCDITTHASLSAKRVYRLVFSDSSVAKARLLVSEEHARNWIRLRRHVGSHTFLCDILAQKGRAVLEEWVEGDVLPMPCTSQDLARRSGQLLAKFHSFPDPDGAGGTRSSSRELLIVRSRFESLVRHGAIPSNEAELLCESALSCAPPQVTPRIIHHDFCGENLVVSDERGVVSIDHEWMQVGAPDLDLARAMQRWSLTDSLRAAFLEGYREADGPGDLDYENFWLMFSELHDAEALVRTKRADADLAVSALRNRLSER
jgi:hypothetical protein